MCAGLAVASIQPPGWHHEIPLGPSMHQRYVDAQLDAQDAKDRAELIERNAKLKAMEKGKP